MKLYGIDDAKTYLERKEDLDVLDQSMLNTLSYLESLDMHGHAMPEYGRIELSVRGRYSFMMNIEFDAERKTAAATVTMPMACVEEKRAVVGELLHRINFITVLGQWRLDPNDGECKIRYIHYIGDNAMSVHQAERMIDICLFEVHRYEDTVIPLMMGREPESEKSCIEYKMMTGEDHGLDGLRQILLNELTKRRKQRAADEISDTDDEDDGEDE